MRYMFSAAIFVLSAPLIAWGQIGQVTDLGQTDAKQVDSNSQELPRNLTFEQIVDRTIVQENDLLKILRGEHPVAETYIQEMGTDADFGASPRSDHYFLGKLDLSKGVRTDSFLPKSN